MFDDRSWIAGAAIVATVIFARGAVGQECPNILTDADAQVALDLTEAGAYDIPAGLPVQAVTYTIPVTLHVVRRSDGTGAIPQSQLDQAMADANLHFAGAGFAFCVAGAVNYIDSDAFYYDIDTLAEINLLRQTDVVPNTINIYFTPNLAYESGGLCGISAFTFSSVQGIVMRNSCTGTWSNPSTFSHELGHYFDLFHTHEPFYGLECTSGANCSTAGDLVCDTPADPTLGYGNVDVSCNYYGSYLPPCGGDPNYAPDTTNLMSYSRSSCRDHFTPGQDSRMLGAYLNRRSELHGGICPSPDPLQVPGQYATLQLAIANAASGDSIHVGPGTYPGPIDFGGKAIEIETTAGPSMTIIDGQQQGPAVVFQSGEGSGSILRGFTIANGTGFVGGETLGGAIYIDDADPLIQSCIIMDSTASKGGAIYLSQSTATIDTCTIVGNTATTGGGLYLVGSDPTISDTDFENNNATSGGAIYIAGGMQPDISNSDFCGNAPTDIVGSWVDLGGNSFPSVCPSLTQPSLWMVEAVADFDADGDDDLFWVHATGVRYLWLLDGTNVSSSAPMGVLSPDWRIVGTGDFNGDNRVDLLWHHQSAGSTSIWLMNGTGVDATGTIGIVPSVWQVETVGDFNGDARADILWRHQGSGVMSMWFLDGIGVLSTTSPGTVSLNWDLALAGNFNGDNMVDLFWRHTSGQNSIWLMNGAAVISTGSPGACGTAWSPLGGADLGGDGLTDIIWRHATTDLVYVWELSGTTVADHGAMGSVSAGWEFQGAGEFNGDPNRELLWRNPETSSTVFWELDGSTVTGAGVLPES